MKHLTLAIFGILLLLGCRPADPIERVARKESSNEYFHSGMYSLLDLPVTATAEQVIGRLFGASVKILTNREVRISNDKYTAVLVETDGVRKVALIRYERGAKLSGWWSTVYDD